MKKKTIILLIAMFILCTIFASVVSAERVNKYDYTLSGLKHSSSVCSANFFLAELSYTEGKTYALPMDTIKVSKDDIYHAYMFDEDNQFLRLEDKLRWLVNNSIINDNKTAAQLKSDINMLAITIPGFPSIRGNLSNTDAVAGTQAALWGLTAPAKSAAPQFSQDRISMNFYAVLYYYEYMLDCQDASTPLILPKSPLLSIDIEKDIGKDLSTTLISDTMYKVLPYTYTHSNNGTVDLVLTDAPTGSYIDDKGASTFNVYVPVESDTDGADITVLGTITAETPYTDICTYAAANSSGSMLLGEAEFISTHTAQDTDTSSWVFPAVFAYELTLTGKQSGEPVEGVEFTLSDGSGINMTKTTDSNGEIFFGFAPCGQYSLGVNKTSADDAGLDTSLDEYGLFTATSGLAIDASARGIHQGSFEITELPASICLYKYCDKTELPLPFAVFGLYDGSSRTPIAQATSDASGKVLFENLYPGNGKTYTIKEDTNPVGYRGDYEKKVTLSRGENFDSSVSREKCIISNRPKEVPITAFVKDEVNLNPIANATVSIYEGDYSSSPIPSTETALTYGVTDAQGKIILSGLKFTPDKQYTILQTATISDYNIDTNKYLLDLASIQLSTEVTFFNAPIKGAINVEILTTRADNYYDGLEFLLIGAPEYPSTEQNRVGSIANLATSYTSLYPGTYKLHQVVPPVGYTEDTTVDLGINVTLAAGETKTITLHDTDLYDEGNISLLKEDDSDNALEGAQFNLYFGSIAELDAMTATQLDTALLTSEVTDANGLIEFGQFRPGTYTVMEVAAPLGYIIPTENRLEFCFEDGNVVIGPVVNVYDPDVTPTPAPTPTLTPSPTATTPPDIPATGEGSFLYIAAALFAIVGIGLFVFRKKISGVCFKQK